MGDGGDGGTRICPATRRCGTFRLLDPVAPWGRQALPHRAEWDNGRHRRVEHDVGERGQVAPAAPGHGRRMGPHGSLGRLNCGHDDCAYHLYVSALYSDCTL